MEYLVTFYQDLPDYKRPGHTSKTVYAGNDVIELTKCVYRFMHDHLWHHEYDESMVALFYDRHLQPPSIETLFEDVHKFERLLVNEYDACWGSQDMYYEESGTIVIQKWDGKNLVCINI